MKVLKVDVILIIVALAGVPIYGNSVKNVWPGQTSLQLAQPKLHAELGETLTNTTVVKGQNASFYCEVIGVQGLGEKLNFYKYNGSTAMILSSDNETNDNSEGKLIIREKYRLNIINTTFEDEGQYACQLDSKRHEAFLTVLDPPKTVYMNLPRCADCPVDKFVNITCTTSASRPSVQMRWFRNGRDVTSLGTESKVEGSNGYTQTVSRFEINPASDIGNIYTCRVDFPQWKGVIERQLTVYDCSECQGDLLDKMTNTSALIGTNGSLTCNVESGLFPGETLIFLKIGENETSTIGDASHGTINSTKYMIAESYRLIIFDASFEDESHYECVHTNVSGSQTRASASLTVADAPSDYNLYWSRRPDVDVLVQLTCETSASKPPAKFRWFRDNTDITNTAFYTAGEIDEKGYGLASSYIVFIPDWADEGVTFTCQTDVAGVTAVHVQNVTLSLGTSGSAINNLHGLNILLIGLGLIFWSL